MAEFDFKGVDNKGKTISGMIEAPDETQLRMMLRTQGIRPTHLKKKSKVTGDLSDFFKFTNNIPQEILVSFTRQLHILISSGIPLVQALEVLKDQTLHPGMRTILTKVKERVTQGGYLWESLNQYASAFPKLYIALIRAGEASGTMDQMLKRLSRYLEDAARLKRMVKGAMIYPLVTVAVGLIVVVLMMTLVIPKFEEMLSQNGQELPGPTKFLVDMSHWMRNNIVVLAVGVFGGGYVLLRYLKTEEGRSVMDRATFNAPIFGTLMQKAGIARFSRTMQTLLASGVNLLDAVDVCKATVDNAVLEEAIGKIRAQIETGKTLGAVVARLGVFPKMAIEMMLIGETTGNLDKMLEKIADFYEEEVEAFVGNISKIIEPVILVVLGGLVGGMMIAMYLPVFKMAANAG